MIRIYRATATEFELHIYSRKNFNQEDFDKELGEAFVLALAQAQEHPRNLNSDGFEIKWKIEASSKIPSNDQLLMRHGYIIRWSRVAK